MPLQSTFSPSAILILCTLAAIFGLSIFAILVDTVREWFRK